jgi:hypothetical protein
MTANLRPLTREPSTTVEAANFAKVWLSVPKGIREMGLAIEGGVPLAE